MFKGITKKFLVDAAERVGFVAAYGAISETIIVVSDINQIWAPVLITGLSSLKALVARHIGNPDSAGMITR